MILLTIMAIVATATLQVGQLVQRREAEAELLSIGSEFRLALISYEKATPAGAQSAPGALGDLLKDPRFPYIRRHLRKLYLDPVTGKSEWGVVLSKANQTGIVGIHSLSSAKPIKIGYFEPIFQHFQGSVSYANWIFTGVSGPTNVVLPQTIPASQQRR